MRVTHVIPYMHPRAGGPPVVVDRFCRSLTQRGWSCRVLTTDALARGDASHGTDCYRSDYTLDVYPSRGGPFAYSPELAAAMTDAVAQSDLVHLHTLWTYPGIAAIRACRRLRVPLVVMPHGMLDPHSLQRKRWKKALYARFVEWPNLKRAAGMIYTHSEEQRLAELSCPDLPPGSIVPLGADQPPTDADLAEGFWAKFPRLRGKRLILFLSRLHPKKGLDLLIPAFARVARQQPDVELLLVGDGEPGYVRHLRQLAAREDIADRTTFAGPLLGRDKWSALAAGTLLILPSYQENFALVVAEALAAKLPVILSRRVNIWRDVAQAGAGAVCELSLESIAETLSGCLASEEFLRTARERGPRLVSERFNWERSTDALVLAYERALSQFSRRHDGVTVQ